MSIMRVLLLGEFSGFYLNLKQGLQEIGVDVTLAANGDGWKKIEGADRELYRTEDKNPIKKLYFEVIEPVLKANDFSGYDVVSMVNSKIFYPQINSYIFNRLKANNGSVFISLAGSTYSLYKAWKEKKIGYYIYDDNPESTKIYESNGLKAQMQRKTEAYVEENADGIIPIMYEYAVGIRNNKNCRKTIPIPFDVSKVKYHENKVKDKIVFFHGLLREKDKGTQYIREAFDIIKRKYPNDVECIMAGRLPLKEYLDVLSRTNVLVDQCKEHCWGLNACYAMAEGKVVLGGASRNSLKEFGLTDTPVKHIGPSVEQIVCQMERLIEERREIEKFGYESRKFVETFHNHIEIAQQYVEEWSK